MQLSAFLRISNIPCNEFESISETVNTYFNTLEDKPEDLYYWMKDLVFDKEEQEIRGVSDMSVNQDIYESVLRELIEAVAEQHPDTVLSGYYDLYNDNFGSCYYKFRLSDGQLDWELEDESEEAFMEEFEGIEDFDNFEF